MGERLEIEIVTDYEDSWVEVGYQEAKGKRWSIAVITSQFVHGEDDKICGVFCVVHQFNHGEKTFNTYGEAEGYAIKLARGGIKPKAP